MSSFIRAENDITRFSFPSLTAAMRHNATSWFSERLAELESLKAIGRLDAPVYRVFFDPLGENRLTLPAAQLPAVLGALARMIDYPDLTARLESIPGQEGRAELCRRLHDELSALQLIGT